MNDEAPRSTPINLESFAHVNPEATVETTEEAFLVSKPWGDDSLTFRVSHEARAVADALNSLRLPPRFSAIWHRDTLDIEFIYGPIPANDELRGRRFTFYFDGRPLVCEFAEASERLVHVANSSRIVGRSLTLYRNLRTTREYFRVMKRVESGGANVTFELTSFWIRNCDVNEADLPDLAHHINFYMRYFDRSTPVILVHEDHVGKEAEKPTRFLFGPFPTHIAGHRLDPYMLTLWESGMPGTAEPVASFLYNYQVLEYAAFYYVKEEIARTIRRIVSSPDILGRAEEASRQILDALVEERTAEEAKIASVVQQAVDPAALWEEIAGKEVFFSEPVEFDGGFAVPALIKKGWSLEDFKGAWLPKVPDSFRKLRNALLHAREQRLSKCIAPTTRNAALLRPWSSLISIASSQIILFGNF